VVLINFADTAVEVALPEGSWSLEVGTHHLAGGGRPAATGKISLAGDEAVVLQPVV
jgi:hypothetical protein